MKDGVKLVADVHLREYLAANDKAGMCPKRISNNFIEFYKWSFLNSSQGIDTMGYIIYLE